MADSVPTQTDNKFRWKLWAAVGAASWLGGCEATDGDLQNTAPESNSTSVGMEGEGHGGGEGEGEGHGGGEGKGEGEGEGGSTGTNYSTNDVAYLSQLGLMRGHLKVGSFLYENGHPELASTHMKHPEMELYSSLVEAFRKRDCRGFAPELEALSNAVNGGDTAELVDKLYESVVDKIANCESRVTSSPRKNVAVIESLLRTAGEEYAIGVVAGRIENLHEFQDAWGFTQVAKVLSRSSLFADGDRSVAVAAQIQSIIEDLTPMWPDLADANQQLDTVASQLYGAAAQIEIIALSLKE